MLPGTHLSKFQPRFKRQNSVRLNVSCLRLHYFHIRNAGYRREPLYPSSESLHTACDVVLYSAIAGLFGNNHAPSQRIL